MWKYLDVIYQKRVRVFHRGFQTRPSAFIVFESLETPMKHEQRVFETAFQTCNMNLEQ